MCVCVRACVRVCVCDRASDRATERACALACARAFVCVCVCVCVCVSVSMYNIPTNAAMVTNARNEAGEYFTKCNVLSVKFKLLSKIMLLLWEDVARGIFRCRNLYPKYSLYFCAPIFRMSSNG